MSADAIKLLKPKVFDKSKWMRLPRDVVIGHDVFGQIPSVCEDLKLGTSALLISGKGTMVLAGNKVLDTSEEQYGKTVYCKRDQRPHYQKGPESRGRHGLYCRYRWRE